MRELVLRVPTAAVEDVLDRLMGLAPAGVRVEPAGRSVRLRIAGTTLPPRATVEQAAGRWPYVISEREIPHDWQARRVAGFRPELIGGRLVVRPEWAPTSRAAIEIVLSGDEAFGSGAHPTTRALLEMLLGLAPSGPFADLGCGSGVLAIAAAKLGFSPVSAVDLQPVSVAAAQASAARNGVDVDVSVGDLTRREPLPVRTFAANMPTAVHLVLAAGAWLGAARSGLISGFGEPDESAVLAAYGQAGLHAADLRRINGWVIASLAR